MGNGKALARADEGAFLALRAEDGGESIAEVIKENMGPGGLRPQDLLRVKVPAGGATTWEMPVGGSDEPESVKEFAGIILAAKDVRACWHEQYSGKKNPPDCVSEDMEFGRGDPGGACHDCPKNVWGSAKDEAGNPKRGKACKEMKMLLILLPESHIPIMLSIPPSSLDRMAKYMLRLSNQVLKYMKVVTVLGLVKDQNADGIVYSAVKFTQDRKLTQDELESLARYSKAIMPAFERAAVEQDEAGAD